VQALQGLEKAVEVEVWAESRPEVQVLLETGKRLEEQGKLESALEIYRQAQELAAADPSLRSLTHEIDLTIRDVEKRGVAQTAGLRPPTETPASFVSTFSPLTLGEGHVRSREGPKVREEEPIREQPGWDFWLLWVIASAVGWALSIGIADALADFGGVELVVIGAIVGTAQWLVLRRQLHSAGWWILASAMGLILSYIIIPARPVSEYRSYELLFEDAFRGVVIGTAQWLVLRRQIHRAIWHILASAVGNVVVGSALYVLYVYGVMRAIVLTVGEAITGAVLVWLLRQPRPEDENTSRAD
jgi:hypothetical protein